MIGGWTAPAMATSRQSLTVMDGDTKIALVRLADPASVRPRASVVLTKP
jgi:hypothetical protein